ncbi:hypothetical protein KUTeg_012252, partial [Tegillarca granosa]
MTHGPTTFLISLYFEKRRNLANAILVSGGSFGGLVFPQVYRFLLDQLELRGALLITSGMLLQSVVGASLLRPTGFYKSKQENTKNSDLFDAVDDKYRERSMTDPVNGVVTSLQIKESELSESKRKLWSIVIFSVVHGLLAGALVALIPSIVIDFLGIESYRTAMGLTLLSQGLVMSTGLPVIGCTINTTLVVGSTRAFGIYFVEFISTFDADVSMTSLINGLLQITYSVGFGLINGPTTYLTSLYFDKRRNLVNTILLSGGGIGGLILPPIYRFLLDLYELRGALLITVGILHHSVAASEMWSIILFSVIHGLLSGSIVALSPALIIDFLSLDNYRTAMGVALLFQGFAMCAVLPIIGIYTLKVSLNNTRCVTRFYRHICDIISGFRRMLPVVIYTYNVIFTALPVLTVGLRIISVRQSVMIGAFLCSLSYGLNSLATNIEYLIVTQGIIFGSGSAFMFSTSLILLGRYFKKYRGLANGVAIAGSSLGGLVLPPIFSYILNTYGLYGGMIVTSGILLNIFVAAALLRPPSFYETKSNKTPPRYVANEKPIQDFEIKLDGNAASSLPMLVSDNGPVELHNTQ